MSQRFSLAHLVLLALCFALSIACISLLDERKADRRTRAAVSSVAMDGVSTGSDQGRSWKELRQLLEELPSGTRVLSVKTIRTGYWGLYYLVTAPSDPDADRVSGFDAISSFDVWLVSADGSGLAAPIASYSTHASAFGDIDWTWIEPAEGSAVDYRRLALSVELLGEGMFSWSEKRTVLLNGDRVPASFSLSGFPEGFVDVGRDTYRVRLLVENGCEKGRDDVSTGILFGDQELLFRKPYPISCPGFGEEWWLGLADSGSFFAFLKGEVLRISVEGKRHIDLDLRKREFSSPDLKTPAPLNAPTSRGASGR